MNTDMDLSSFIKKYYIESKGFYFPKISVLRPGESKPPKYTFAEVEMEFHRRQNTHN